MGHPGVASSPSWRCGTITPGRVQGWRQGAATLCPLGSEGLSSSAPWGRSRGRTGHGGQPPGHTQPDLDMPQPFLQPPK